MMGSRIRIFLTLKLMFSNADKLCWHGKPFTYAGYEEE